MGRLAIVMLLAVFGLLVASSSRADEDASSILILSKADVRAIFAMSQEDWHEKLRTAVSEGVAVALGTTETGLAMATKLPTGQMILVPHYTDKGRKPNFIDAFLVYDYPFSAVLVRHDLEKAIEDSISRLEPDYEVFGEIEENGGTITILFSINERAP